MQWSFSAWWLLLSGLVGGSWFFHPLLATFQVQKILQSRQLISFIIMFWIIIIIIFGIFPDQGCQIFSGLIIIVIFIVMFFLLFFFFSFCHPLLLVDLFFFAFLLSDPVSHHLSAGLIPPTKPLWVAARQNCWQQSHSPWNLGQGSWRYTPLHNASQSVHPTLQARSLALTAMVYAPAQEEQLSGHWQWMH